MSDTTPEQWRELAAHGHFTDHNGWQRIVHEGDTIADMLIPLAVAADGRWRYTCRHHDQATGDCRIYETRPTLCRDYPYGDDCEQPECTAPNRGRDFVPVARLQRGEGA